jgi:lysylphosphatidylglycerol synthetase-like protein (DUF2156 family)
MSRIALATIFASMVAIASCYASAFLPNGAPEAAGFVFAIAIAALMVAVLVLGATRGKRAPVGALRWVFAFCFLVLTGGFSFALVSPAVTPDSRLWLGLPQGAAIILYIVGVLPLLVLPMAYAMTFDNTTLSEGELAELRRKLAELKVQGERGREREREGALT